MSQISINFSTDALGHKAFIVKLFLFFLLIGLTACGHKKQSLESPLPTISAPRITPPSPQVLTTPKKIELEDVSLWTDTTLHAGWRIQKHYYSGISRVIDARNRLRAQGDNAQCQTAFTWLLYKEKVQPVRSKLALLIHGVRSGPMIWSDMRHALKQEGYEATTFTYPSTEQSLVGNAKALLDVLKNFSPKHYEEIVMIAHSMGGLIVRGALGDTNAADISVPIRAVVMLGTPNKGSSLASLLGPFARAAIAGSANDLQPERVRLLPPIPDHISLGIIAGGRGKNTYGYNFLLGADNDGVILVSEAKTANMQDFLRLPVLHINMADDKQVIQATRNFLRMGRFRF